MPSINIVDFEISHAQDWNDALPVLTRADNTYIDLTGKTLELYIRPRLNNTVLIKKLWSNPDDPTDVSGGIVIDNETKGLASIFVSRADVIDAIPSGAWQQFLILKTPNIDLTGFDYEQLWRGALTVLPDSLG